MIGVVPAWSRGHARLHLAQGLDAMVGDDEQRGVLVHVLQDRAQYFV